MTPTPRSAVRKADEIRRKLKLSMFQPVNIFDICQQLDVDVRFIDVSMEGMYASNGNRPTILLSGLRPLPRRCFTCAHELGHHIYGHGNRIDVLYTSTDDFSDDEEELLVNIFAGALLMPMGAIQSQFAKRKWDIKKATPIQFYIVASAFGVGYSTLITQCFIKELIPRPFGNELLKFKPSTLLKQIIGKSENTSYFKIIDQYSGLNVIDLEVSNFLIVPQNGKIEGDHLKKIGSNDTNDIFVAERPGITRITNEKITLNAFLRIQKENYIGLAEYRHLEN
jgi:Zn-dependent peptidase ImmA (M78 family)